MTERVRTVAFYLPQFHRIDENDEWWGSGFTDWTNLRRAAPLFDGHSQPREPTDLGYYDLADSAVIHRQAFLARANGIDAFCMYFYWFDGRRLLERPLDDYMTEGPAFPICICWANENWTRRWDGKDSEVLMAQRYDPDTPVQVFAAWAPYLSDSRYLRQDGAAVLLVHRADHLPDPAHYAAVWRAEATRLGIGPLYLVAVETTRVLDPRGLGFDALVEFPPVGSNTLASALWRPVAGLRPGFRGRLLSYERLAARFRRRRAPRRYVRHGGVMPGWDNTPRRGEAATVFVGSSPAAYADWLRVAREREAQLRGRKGLVFINAWNEWAEGAYLEPDALFGTAYLAATRPEPGEGLPSSPALSIAFPRAGHLRALANVAASSGVAAYRRVRHLVLRVFR